VVSGGEPTLDRNLAGHVRLARASGFERVGIETNAVACARGDLARGLREAGLDEALVSLHSAEASVSDALTRAPGTHARTLLGIGALMDAGVRVSVNAVMTSASIGTLAELPAALRATLGPRRRLSALVVSDPVEPYDVGAHASLLPHPCRVREVLPLLIDAAERAGIGALSLGGPCGPPLCAHGADPRVTDLAPKPAVGFRVHPPACSRCAVRDACFGVRETALRLFGEACTAPIEGAR
jgi:hypothetical protein